MPSLLLMVFFLQVAIHLVNTVGASTIDSTLWDFYCRLPIPQSPKDAEHRKLQGEFLRLRRELNATSSQDEFAKWAKLRRQHDKVQEQLEKSKANSDATKASFDKIVSVVRWVFTNGARMFVQFWFSKQPMFWLPKGLVPYYAEWLLSFPRAPLGSISIQIWQLACGSVVLLFSDAVAASIGLVTGSRSKMSEKPSGRPMAFTSDQMPQPAPSEKSEAKKEL